MTQKIRNIAFIISFASAVLIAATWLFAQYFRVTYINGSTFFYLSRQSVMCGNEPVHINPNYPVGLAITSASLRSETFYLIPSFHINFDVWQYALNAPFPHSLAASLFATVALGRGRTRRKRPIKPVLCKQCGYELTGNTTGVCPECGQVKEQPLRSGWVSKTRTGGIAGLLGVTCLSTAMWVTSQAAEVAHISPNEGGLSWIMTRHSIILSIGPPFSPDTGLQLEWRRGGWLHGLWPRYESVYDIAFVQIPYWLVLLVSLISAATISLFDRRKPEVDANH